LTLAWHSSSSLHLWTGYSEAVRDPSLGERFGYPFTPTIPVTENQFRMNNLSYLTIPNPDIKPEICRTVEAGIRWRRDKMGIHFRGYLKSTDDLIQGIFTEDWAQYTNQTKADFKGMETSINAGPWLGLTGSLVVNLIDATDAEGNNLLEIPDTWGNGTISWQHSFFQNDLDVHICLAGRYWSGFWKHSGESPDKSFLVYQDPGFCMDIKIFCTVIRNVTLSFAVDNILGNDYSFVSLFPLPQQTTRIGITWELLD
jgi:outer membrane cobalamin receptor